MSAFSEQIIPRQQRVLLLTAAWYPQRKALEETKAVIPSVRERITNAREKLESYLVRHTCIFLAS